MNGKIDEELLKFPLFSLLIREFDPESGSHETTPSATESVISSYNWETAENTRVSWLLSA